MTKQISSTRLAASLLAATLIALPKFASASEPWLQLATSISKKHFIRIGYTAVVSKVTSSDVRDLDGPLLRYGDSKTPGLAPEFVRTLEYMDYNIRLDHPNDFAQQEIGVPPGVKADLTGGGTPVITVGTYLDDARRQSIEVFALGLPIKGNVYGAGIAGGEGAYGVDVGKLGTSDQLGPLFIGRYHFGGADDALRFNIGLAATYVVFFNARPTKALEAFVGGPSSMHVKSAFGFGPVLGLSYRLGGPWFLDFTVAKLKMSTKATIMTRTDPQIVGRSRAAVLGAANVGPNAVNAVNTIAGGLDQAALNAERNQLPKLFAGLAKARTGDETNLGTYRREVAIKVDPVLVNFGIGYDF
jgi:outer membrane protein W